MTRTSRSHRPPLAPSAPSAQSAPSARSARSVLAALAALVAGILTWSLGAIVPATGSAYPPEEPVRVMFVGDSLTHGRNGDATFRYYLWQELASQGIPASFVGPRADLKRRPGVKTWYLRHDRGFERRHAAEGGSGFPQHLPDAAGLVTAYRPDVVVLFLGFNDVKWRSPLTVAAHARQYADAVWSVDPTVRIVIGEITATSDRGLVDTGHLRSSAETNTLVAHLLGHDPRVTIAHTRTDGPDAHGPTWDPSIHTYDGTHPTVTGQTLLAQRFAEAFHRMGVLPAAPRVYRETRWDPRPRATAQVDGARVRLTWKAERDRLYYASMKLVVRDGQGRRVLRTAFRDATRMTLTLTPGRYTARLTADRDGMVSRPGPKVRFRVTCTPSPVTGRCSATPAPTPTASRR